MEQPTPDDKNWTWVLERPCPQCGYDAASSDRGELAARVRTVAAAWRRALGRGDLVARRPPVAAGQSPVWSALEYGCHVRDVFQLFTERLGLMITEDDPTFSSWDQNRAAVDGGYTSQDPARVAYALGAAAGKVADMVDRVGGAQWERTGIRADGDRFTIESLVRYLLHDVEHHLWDVARGYEALTGDGDAPGEDETAGDGGPDDSDDGDGGW